VKSVFFRIVFLSIFLFFGGEAVAQTIPSTADSARIKPTEDRIKTPKQMLDIKVPKLELGIESPKGASEIELTLTKVKIKGATAFSHNKLKKIYKEYLNKKISLSKVWLIADKITKYYHDKGYFLSQAYVPAQEVDDGNIIIKVVEGSISDVQVDEYYANKLLFKMLIKRLTQKSPLKISELESFMLQVNSLPKSSFKAVLEPVAKEGQVKLHLNKLKKKDLTTISLDNYGSRFVGPYQATLSYRDSFLPSQETTLSLLAAVPAEELRYVALSHEIPFYPDVKAIISGNYVKSEPGFTLGRNDIRSESAQIAFDLVWQPVRQRRKNLILTAGIMGKNVNGDILVENPLTRDRIRKVVLKANYDRTDGIGGYNYADFGIEQGIEVLGATKVGEDNISRAGASPDFSKITYSYTRVQTLPKQFSVIGRVSGQVAFEPLYSSEEFGYGGQSFGRAYDSSEITGDSGVAGSIEMRYRGIPKLNDVYFLPYGFYDVGKVWNEDEGGVGDSAASTGLGLQISFSSKLNAEIGIAWPLTRPINTPLYGNGKRPRYLFKVSSRL